MAVINVHEAEPELARLIDRAMCGEEVIITRDGQPLVKLTPIVAADHTPRVGGQWQGRVKIAEDFDTLPPDIAEAFGVDLP